MRRVALLLLTCLCLVLPACGNNGGDDEPTASPTDADPTPARTVNPGQRGPSAVGTFEFDGALKLTGDYTVLYPFFDEKVDTCAEIASKEPGRYVVPLPSFHGDRRFEWTAGLRTYPGPGTFDLEDLDAVSVGLRAKPEAKAVQYSAREGATVKLVVNKDNGGSFQFEGLENTDGDTLSGEAKWTCEEGSEGEK